MLAEQVLQAVPHEDEGEDVRGAVRQVESTKTITMRLVLVRPDKYLATQILNISL